MHSSGSSGDPRIRAARTLHTHRHAARNEGQAGSGCVPVAQARHSLRARADHLRLARRHCDLPSDAAGGDKEQVVNTTSLNDRAAGSLHRRAPRAGRFAPGRDSRQAGAGKDREAVRFGTVHSPCGKEKAHAATWAKQNSYMRKDTP